jgi:hypothetical protein
MPIGNTPINQLNALPLVSAQSVGDPGDVVVVGNTIRRYWSPAALLGSSLGNSGVAGNVADPFQPGTRSGFITLMLDVTGCNFFTIIMVMRAATAGNDLGNPGWSIAPQHVGIGLNGTSITPGGGAASNLAFPSPLTLSVGARLTAAAGANQDRTGEANWSGASAGARMQGSLRLYFWADPMAGTPVEQLWWPTMWGQG